MDTHSFISIDPHDFAGFVVGVGTINEQKKKTIRNVHLVIFEME